MAVRSRALVFAGSIASVAAVCRPSCASAQASGVMQATVTVVPASVERAQIARWAGAGARLTAGRSRSLEGGEPGIRTTIERKPAQPATGAQHPGPTTLRITVTYLR